MKRSKVDFLSEVDFIMFASEDEGWPGIEEYVAALPKRLIDAKGREGESR